jgi:hypothetical protein
LARDGRRSHLSPGHTVIRIINKKDGQILSTVCSMYDFGCSDGGKITVALVRKDDFVRHHPLQRSRYSRWSAVCGFKYIKVEIVVGKDSATDRRNAYHPGAYPQLIDRFGDKPVDQAMAAARTVPEGS